METTPEMSFEQNRIDDILREIKEELSHHYGKNLLKTLLYGSYARGTQGPESDIDIAVVLEGEIDKYQEVENLVELTDDISLENDVMISLLPLTIDEYEKGRYSIFFNIRNEGILI